MNNEWIIIEVLAVLVEKGAVLYFLNSRYQSKYNSSVPNWGAWSLLVICGLIVVHPYVAIHAVITHLIMLIYLVLFKNGLILHKIFGILIVFVLITSTSIIGAGFASLITSSSIEHTLLYQDTSRLFALIFIKALQVAVFYTLAKRHEKERNLRKRPAIFLFVAVAANFVYLAMLRIYVESPDLQPQQNYMLIWLAVGALLMMIGIFIVYELFIREEARNVELATKLQRINLETGFFKEMDKLYYEIRIWRHDYENNIKVLRALVAKAEIDSALKFMNNMNSSIMDSKIMIQTGNFALDVIINAKLVLAKSHGIEIDVEAIYPEGCCVSDNDLCVIAGNMIDNAIEACLRISDIKAEKFINIVIGSIKKNLYISICNSYGNDIIQKDGRFFTSKKEPNHGIGIKHVDAVINKYQGYVKRSQDAGVFTTIITLPLEASDKLRGGIGC